MLSEGSEKLLRGKELCLLSLDGGGVRGLSSLYLLKKLMETVSIQNPPKPCDYFDMIGGTSTGGLIAIMLGRLEMTVDECIEAYKTMSRKIFTKIHHRLTMRGKVQGRFDHTAIEQAVQELLQNRGLKKDELLRKSGANFCKTFVCATSKQSGNTVIFSSYLSERRGRDLLDTATIWQAARATSAATSFFDPIEIGHEEFVDGATPANNPLMELWSEAHDVFSDLRDTSWNLEQNVACVVSIGTGVPTARPFGDDPLQIGAKLVKIATDTEKVARDFARNHPSLLRDGQYFRFNVNKGLENIKLEEHERSGEIIAATRHYIQTQEVFASMVSCAMRLSQKQALAKNYLFACRESEREGVKTLRSQARQRANVSDVTPSSEILSWFTNTAPYGAWVKSESGFIYYPHSERTESGLGSFLVSALPACWERYPSSVTDKSAEARVAYANCAETRPCRMIDVLRLLLSQTLTLCFPTENLWLEAITAVTTIERRQAGNDIETASTRALYNILSAILASAREVSTHGKALRMLFVIKDIHHLQGPDVAKEIIYLRAELGRMGVHVLITGRSKLANNSSWGAKGFPRVDEDTEYNEFLNSLKFDHMHTRRNQVSTPFHGTNTWIQSHPIFSKWERSQSGVLWIQGKPGSGKSVLAKSILKTFPDVILASWFYSKRGGVVGVSHTSMLRSICYQILQQKKGLFASCAQTYRRKAFSDNYHNYLTAILEAIATSEDEQPILCLLDGLDESADRDDEGGRRTLELLADLSEAPGSRLKVIVLSRPYRTIEQTYGTYDILLEAENAADIGVIIDQGLAAIATALERNGPGGLSPFARRRRQQLDGDPDDAGGILGLMSDIEQKQEIQNIKEYLVEHARGVTLWVTLSIDQALRYTSRGTVTWTSLRAMLASLPFELNEMYRVITNEITQDCTAEHVKMGRKILAWVMVASTKRPLLVKELFDAMCIPENEDIIPDGDNDPIRANRPVFKSWSYLCRSIQDICGPLLEFVTASQSGTFSYDRLSKVTGRSVVQLIHQTAKDYLEGGQDTVFAFESSEVLSVVTNEARSYMMLVIPPSPRKYTPVLSDVADDWKSKVVAMLTYLDDKFLLPFVLSHFPPNSDYVETAERLALSTDSHWILSAFYNHMTYREIETPGVLEETVVGWCFTVACNMGLHTAIDNLLYLTSLHPGWWAVHREAVLGVALQVAKTRQIADLADRIQENRDSFVWPAIQRSESDRPDILLRASLSRRQSRTGIIAIGRMETLDWIDSNNHNMRPACEPVLPSTARVSDVREAICRILHYLSGNMHPLGLNVNSMTSGLRRSVGAGTPSRSLSGAALGSRVSTLRVGDTSQTQSWASTLEENSQDHTNWI